MATRSIGYELVVSITRHDDGSLTVPVEPGRHDVDADGEAITEIGSMVIRPGEGGYNAALAEWETEQHPDRADVVSTASGRESAMSAVHAMAQDSSAVRDAVDDLDDPAACADSLRHVLVGGTHAVEAFANEIVDAEGGDPIPAHSATRIIGELLAEIDSRSA